MEKKELPPTLISTRKHNAIFFLHQNQLIIACDSTFESDTTVQKFTVQPLCNELNKQPRYVQLETCLPLLWSKGIKILDYSTATISQADENTLILLYARDKRHYFTEEEWSELACHTVWVSNEWSKKKQELIEREITARGGKVLLEEKGDVILPCLPSY